MRNKSLSINNPRQATSYLRKLLHAADRAKSQGKYLALGKVLKEANKLSEHIRKTEVNPFLRAPSAEEHKKAIAELQWLKYKGAKKAPEFNVVEYKKVTGEIIDN